MAPPRGKRGVALGGAVALSVSGMGFHTIREFGLEGTWAIGTGFVPIMAIQAVLFVLWWRIPEVRTGMAKALLATGLFQLIGGGILSVLPLPFLPFVPEQTADHYLSHVVLAVAQAPLIAVALRRPARLAD